MAYINIGNAGFRETRRKEYVDKSGLIAVVNDTLFTKQKYSCVTRCRRFGKSMAAEMLAAYYDKSCDSRSLFADLKIASDPSFDEHLNKYPVIYLDLSDFVTRYKNKTSIVKNIDKELQADIHEAYLDVPIPRGGDLMAYLVRISEKKDEHFIFIVDEWDAICREFRNGTPIMDEYLDWMRRMFKGGMSAQVFAGVYMTGILPVKKFKTQSAMNNFMEYSMVSPGDMASFFGFTKDEVRTLAAKHGMDFDDMEKWYDGYQIGPQPSIFNPNSVMTAIRKKWCESYWGRSAAYDNIADYIHMNFDGLKDDIINMLAGGRVVVDPAGFRNDLSQIESRDDVLTVLIHLGYLSYDRVNQECYIPNKEVGGEMEKAVVSKKWTGVTEALLKSRQLLQDTLSGDSEAVARALDAAHSDDTTILSYNKESSMACVLSLAYYYARNNYFIFREMPTGKGFADLVLLPRKKVDDPAIFVELKMDKAVNTAIDQIRTKNYPAKVAEYMADHSHATMLLVGISYDKKEKRHRCAIEHINYGK